MKLIKRLFKVLTIIFLSILTLLVIINIPILTLNHKTSDENYNSWMSETLESNQKIIDTVMLGAHDAFSNEIDIFSKLDELSADDIMKGFTGSLIKGFIVKQSVTQIDSVDKLFNSGVRYFDVRLTYDEGNWYTKHNYVSGDFNLIADQLVDVLEENPGEFVILDFQHIDGIDYSSSEDYDKFIEMLTDNSLIDYAYEIADLSTLTYGELTNDKTESKIIIISKFADSSGKILQYQNSIRSQWANSDDFYEVYNFLQEEADDILLSPQSLSGFRVMQAVTTMQMSPGGIINGIYTWSLINRAKHFNHYIINTDEFDDLVQAMPIIMVDYSNTNYKDFNDNIMTKIMDFNENS